MQKSESVCCSLWRERPVSRWTASLSSTVSPAPISRRSLIFMSVLASLNGFSGSLIKWLSVILRIQRAAVVHYWTVGHEGQTAPSAHLVRDLSVCSAPVCLCLVLDLYCVSPSASTGWISLRTSRSRSSVRSCSWRLKTLRALMGWIRLTNLFVSDVYRITLCNVLLYVSLYKIYKHL